jgi:hypothetical protein
MLDRGVLKLLTELSEQLFYRIVIEIRKFILFGQ